MANESGGTNSTYTTPGVYIEELGAFPPSVVGVATAVPVFIGYTQFAGDPATGKPLYGTPVQIQSMAEYARYFGGAAPAGGFNFAPQMQFFYDNGGAACYAVSAGSYWAGQRPVDAAPPASDWKLGTIDPSALLGGITAAGDQAGVTMLVVPEACQLDQAGYAQVAQAMVMQAAELQDRMAILDLPGCLTADSDAALLACQAQFWAAMDVPADALSYAAAYAPALLMDDNSILPPSAAMAGAWTRNDMSFDVWKAPANIALVGVQQPVYKMDDDQQAGFNVPVNGMAINVIRAMPARGTLIWGARTLDGNSVDYRYIQVRRTLTYIGQSIKLALQQFVFAPNNGQTWVTVTATVSNFLNDVWRRGGLMGSRPEDAYSVRCGLGSTMTGQDVLDGRMIVSVTLSIIHPAEFIVLTIVQQMGNTNI